MKKIYILRGEKNQGKSSILNGLFKNREGYDGIVCMRGEADLRNFVQLSGEESWLMQGSENDTGPWLDVGRFRFSAEAFRRAENYLRISAKKKDVRVLIIDEIGPLELRKQGFYQVAMELIHMESGPEILLVVRNELVEQVINLFDIPEAIVMFCGDYPDGIFPW
jgi:nucleoside-triphosphatase THEP1